MAVFTNIIGHKGQLESLQEDIAHNNISHAYLFSGPAHIGKRTIAKQFAQHLLCKSAADPERCIQECKKLLHSDLLVLDMLYRYGEQTDWETIGKYSNVSQEHRKKSQSKTDIISIDDIRSLQEVVYDTPIGAYRVCIITNIERMNTASANAFLKLLEEPPSQLIFILTTTAASNLLPTVVSRTRLVHFASVAAADIRSALHIKDPLDEQFILHLAQGAPGLAIELQKNPETLRKAKTVHGIAKQFWQATSFKERLEIAEPLKKRSQDATELLLHLCLTAKELPYNSVRSTQLLQLAHALHSNASPALLVNNFIMNTAEL